MPRNYFIIQQNTHIQKTSNHNIQVHITSIIEAQPYEQTNTQIAKQHTYTVFSIDRLGHEVVK